jgi:drug/metabolite transporter (DMT)-like permease
MPLFALGLLLTAAILHATWNLLLKQAGDKYIVTWWALLVGSLCFLPVLLIGQPLPTAVWPYALGSATFEAAYFGILSAAYRNGDFSLVYPIARGTAPAFLFGWSILFLDEYPSVAGAVGLFIIVSGLVIVGSSAWWNTQRRNPPSLIAVGLALLVALCISLYSVIDGAAVQFVQPVPYTALVFALTTVLITPVVIKRYGWSLLKSQWCLHWQRMSLVGALTLISYMLVVAAYTLAPVSYGGAIREISIVFAALVGWHGLHEDFGAARMIGAIITFGGIVVIAIAA